MLQKNRSSVLFRVETARSGNIQLQPSRSKDTFYSSRKGWRRAIGFGSRSSCIGKNGEREKRKTNDSTSDDCNRLAGGHGDRRGIAGEQVRTGQRFTIKEMEMFLSRISAIVTSPTSPDNVRNGIL